MKWLPVVWSSTKPLTSRNLITTRADSAGNLGIFKINRGNKGVIVRRNTFTVFTHTFNVGGNSVFRHSSRARESFSIGNTPSQSRYKYSKASFLFRTENDVVFIALCCLFYTHTYIVA